MMLTTYILTFYSSDEFKEFVRIIGDINSTPSENLFHERYIHDIAGLMYNGIKNNYVCIFNSRGKILNSSILREKFNLTLFENYKDRINMYLALYSNEINTGYFLFSDQDEMEKHYEWTHNAFSLNINPQELFSFSL